MLQYAKSLVGKPFSNAGMARSIFYPRQTTGSSFFCAGSSLHTFLRRPPISTTNLPHTHISCTMLGSQVTRQDANAFVDPLGPVQWKRLTRAVPRCAELVAAILQRGGLMSSSSNPGAATPQSLHRLYKNQAAVTANPYTLRQFANHAHDTSECVRLIGLGLGANSIGERVPRNYPLRKRNNSPVRASFKCVSGPGSSYPGEFRR